MKATLTAKHASGLKILNRSDAEMVITNIKKELQTWKLKNYLYHTLVGILGTIAIVGSVIVSVYLDSRSAVLTAERLKIIAIASTASLSVLSAFNILSKTNNYIAACDLMQVALFKYTANLIGLGTLIEAYDKANKIIGGIDFNFEKNFTRADGKTEISVITDSDLEETQPGFLNKTEGQPGNEPDEHADKPVWRRSKSETAGASTGKFTDLTAEPIRNATEPAQVKSAAIMDTEGVSVLVSEKK